MQVTWDPRNGDPEQTWTFDPEEVEVDQAKLVEKHYGGTYDQWVAGLQTGEINARQVLLWHMLTQVHPSLRFDALPKFRVKQLKVEMGVAELEKLWARVQRMKLSPDKKDAFQSAFEADLQDALDREGRYNDKFEFDGDKLVVEGAPELGKAA